MRTQTLHHHPDRYQWVINCRQTHYDKTVDSKVKDVGTITESHWPWKKSMPAKSVSANTMQLLSAVLGWPGDGHRCLMYYVEWYVFKKIWMPVLFAAHTYLQWEYDLILQCWFITTCFKLPCLSHKNCDRAGDFLGKRTWKCGLLHAI